MNSLEGRTYDPVKVVIDAESVAAFATAVGADPRLGVPPTYAAVYALATTVPQLFSDQLAALNLARLVHGEQEFEWIRHPKVGEEITAQAKVVGDSERGSMRFVTLETVCTDQDGLAICRSRMLSIIRS